MISCPDWTGETPVLRSEFVPQGKLHDPWLGQQTRVISKSVRYLLQRGDAGASLRPEPRQCVEAHLVEDVEHLPAELQGLMLPRHLPSFSQRHVDTDVPVSANYIARAALSRKWMRKVAERGGWIGEDTD